MPCAKVPPVRRWRPRRAPPAPQTPRRWPAILAVAAVALIVLLPTALAPVDELEHATDTAQAWPTDVNMDPVPVRPGDGPRPVANQKRAPCTAGLELEISGVCWLELAKKPPSCPPQTVAHEGRCLLPVATPRPVPSSVDGGEQPAR